MKNMKVWTGLLIAGMVAAVVVAWPAAARAEATTTTTNEVHLETVVPIVHACTGELLIFDVTFHALEHVTIDANGGTHIKILVQGMRVVGVGTETGIEYVGKNMFTETDYVSADGTEIVTFVRPLHLVSKGSGDNRLRNITMHVTVNAQGETTADLFFDRPMCVG